MSKKYCSRCRKIHEVGECNKEPTLVEKDIAEKKKRDNKRKTYKTYDEMTEEELMIQKFYNSKEWRKKRDEILARSNGLCVICWLLGRVRSATSVHHIKKLREHFELRLDNNNLIAVCRDCHELVESSCSSVDEVLLLIETLKKENK